MPRRAWDGGLNVESIYAIKSTPMRFRIDLHLAFCVILLMFSFVRAQEDDAKETKAQVEEKSFKLTLVDESEKPIAGVKVTAAGIRVDEAPGAWINWPDNKVKNEFLTDERGEIVLNYPVKFGMPGQWITINKIDFNFSHPDFVAGRIECDSAAEGLQHILAEGCRTRFTCVDENGKPIEKFGVVMAGAGGAATWKLEAGELRSGGIPNGSWQTMLVAPSEDGLHRFSGVLPARYAKGKDVTIRNAKLRAGMRLSGSLSENVPRPIEGGKVIAWCLPKPAGNTWGDKEPSIGWSEEATIAADGTFDFPSLPPGGTVQLIALCNGWLIQGREEAFSVEGMEVTVTEQQLADNRVSGVMLEMEPSGTLEVEVFGPDGKPLEGAQVGISPNQTMKLGGSTLLGACFHSVLAMKAQITGDKLNIEMFDKADRFNQKTNAEGKATLSYIPLRKAQRLYVGLKNFRIKKDVPVNNPFAESIQFKCESTELKKLVVDLVPSE